MLQYRKIIFSISIALLALASTATGGGSVAPLACESKQGNEFGKLNLKRVVTKKLSPFAVSIVTSKRTNGKPDLLENTLLRNKLGTIDKSDTLTNLNCAKLNNTRYIVTT